jgi:hypothetical protein
LCYFYRKNPSLFKNNVSFDFLRKESVSTIHLREVGLVQVSIPRLSGKDNITTSKFMEEGGDGIEIYTGTDGFNIPLKILFRSPLAKKKKSTVIELYIRDYAIDNDRYSLPKQYRRLLNKNLFTMNM